LVRKPKPKRPPETPEHKFEDNIRMDFGEII
jgi:hypothetical protein